MAKIAWLVWNYEHTETPEFQTREPRYAFRVQRIVYFEVEED